MHYDFPGKPFRNIELSIVHPRGGNNDVQFVNYDWNTTCNREYKVGRADYIFSHGQCDQKIILTIIINGKTNMVRYIHDKLSLT